MALFALTLFGSAFLLFLIQPMVAKALLPALGGSPAVWNTCMVFFQAALLAGYAFAHITGRWELRWQVGVQLLLLAAALASVAYRLGATASPAPPPGAWPIPWLLEFLGTGIGLPFFALSAMSPLLQHWFAAAEPEGRRDPYFLYAASNAGSVLALAAYPALVEPWLELPTQETWWAGGLAALVVLAGLTGWATLGRAAASVRQDESPSPGNTESIPWSRRTTWVVLAFVPSSLMLGVTTYLSMDIAAIPLLWVVPLGFYLLSFVLTFSRRPPVPHAGLARVLPGLVVVLTVLLLCRDMQPPLVLLLVLHLLTFFVVALYCHGELARDRPPANRLTEFYLWLSIGGVLGGVFNALAAPVLFRSVAEYPIALLLACALVQRLRGRRGGSRAVLVDLAAAFGLGLATFALVWVVPRLHTGPAQVGLALMFGVPATLAYTLVDRPVRMAIGLAAVLVAAQLAQGAQARPLAEVRSFFGVHRVTLDREHGWRQLIHGNTVHGRQSLDPARRGEPLTYYHPTGPIGHVFARRPPGPEARIALIGLGAGSLAAYAGPRQEWTYYEIDPSVEAIARDPELFTFLADCKAKSLRVVLGDGRLRLAEAPDGEYEMIVLDAFSSDAVPVHLLTREALGVYLAKLAPGGLIAFHISNRYLDLKPVVAALAEDAGVVCRFFDDWGLTAEERELGKEPSQWALIARQKEDLGALARTSRWLPPTDLKRVPVWTDHYSSILGLLRGD